MKIRRIVKLKKRLSKIKPSWARFMAALLCISIFVSGLSLGSVDLSKTSRENEIIKILFSSAVFLILVSFFDFFIKTYIEERSQKEVGKSSIARQDLKEIEFEAQWEGRVRENQELEFLSLILQEVISINKISFKGLSPGIKKQLMESIDSLQEKINLYKERVAAREIAIKGLSKGLSDQGKLKHAIHHACNISVGRKPGEPMTEEFKQFRMNIYVYLKAWLICSIKYDIPMPIQPLRKTSQEEQHYMDALKYIQSKVVRGENILPFLPTKASRDIVDQYIGILIRLLQDGELNPWEIAEIDFRQD